MQVTISSIDAKGRGIGATEKGAVAVPFAVPGDVVRVAPRGKRHGVHMGVIEGIVTPSPDRVTPRCPYAGRCGGCPWQMLDYAAQLRHKRDTITRALCTDVANSTTAVVKFATFGVEVLPVLASPEVYYYRNRMDYAFGADGSLGLRAPGSWWRILDLSTCFLLSEDGVRCMELVRAWAREHRVPGWDVRAHTGFLRYLVLREGKRTDDRLAMLITAPGELPARDDLVRRLAPLTTGVLWGVNNTVADVSHAECYETLHGASVLHEEMHDTRRGGALSPPAHGKGGSNAAGGDKAPPLRFQIPPNAFFQTNTLGAEHLIATVREFAALSPTDTLVDLYCGIGMFAIALARDAGRVIGIEMERSAIEAARQNAEMNGITNATFQVIAAESWPFPIEPVDCLVVDPPRAGLHPKTLRKILANAPQRIIYVSCNPTALARDLHVLLSSSGGQVGGGVYRIERIQPIDMFPHSYHVETVVLLKKC